MTDKQEIIINGVDVSKCGHYHYGKCEIDYDEWNNEIIRYNECQNNPNCYYKQLKRKEQENKKLKEDEKSLLNIIDDLQKEKNKWVEKYNDLGQDFDQLKQTLSSIKNIAEKCRSSLYGYDQERYPKQILQQINECEVQNDNRN